MPALGILVAVAIPLSVLYWQRNADPRTLAQERKPAVAQLGGERKRDEELRADESAERLQAARRVAIRNVIAELAPFIGVDLFRPDLNVHPYLVDLCVAAMALVDEYPVEHPTKVLVGVHQPSGWRRLEGSKRTSSG